MRSPMILSHTSARRSSRPGLTFGMPLCIVAACWAAVALGCARPRRPPVPTVHSAVPDLTARVGSIPVDVDNRSSFDVLVYAVQGSTRRRLGSVAGVSRTTMTVPAGFTSGGGTFAIAAVRLAGTESFLSEQISPLPGIRLVLTLQSRLVNSALAVQ